MKGWGDVGRIIGFLYGVGGGRLGILRISVYTIL